MRITSSRSREIVKHLGNLSMAAHECDPSIRVLGKSLDQEGPLRICTLAIAASLVLCAFCSAQDQPLGDVARETRAQTSQHPKATKVVTNDETNAQAITAGDDPLEVVTKAATALLRDASHRCRKVASGDSGPRPGWNDVTVTEVAGVDRIRITYQQPYPPHTQVEEILIGNDGYRRTGNGRWEKLSAVEANFFGRDTLVLPDQLKFGYKSGDLKLIGPQVVDGSPTFLYRATPHDIETDRTINIWIGSNDSLPRKTEMFTRSLRIKTSWQEATSCTYGANITIEPPMQF
jgi:hypothetical protein